MKAVYLAVALFLFLPVVAASQQASAHEESSPLAESSPEAESPPEADVLTLADVAAAQVALEKAAEKIAAGEIAAAFESLQPHWALPKEEIEELAGTLERQRKVLEERYGEALGMELAGVQSLGDSLRRFVYLQKYERRALAWTFIFYRPRDGWILNTLALTERLDGLYEWE